MAAADKLQKLLSDKSQFAAATADNGEQEQVPKALILGKQGHPLFRRERERERA